jgi:hypothetical protein
MIHLLTYLLVHTHTHSPVTADITLKIVQSSHHRRLLVRYCQWAVPVGTAVFAVLVGLCATVPVLLAPNTTAHNAALPAESLSSSGACSAPTPPPCATHPCGPVDSEVDSEVQVAIMMPFKFNLSLPRSLQVGSCSAQYFRLLVRVRVASGRASVSESLLD